MNSTERLIVDFRSPQRPAQDTFIVPNAIMSAEKGGLLAALVRSMVAAYNCQDRASNSTVLGQVLFSRREAIDFRIGGKSNPLAVALVCFVIGAIRNEDYFEFDELPTKLPLWLEQHGAVIISDEIISALAACDQTLQLPTLAVAAYAYGVAKLTDPKQLGAAFELILSVRAGVFAE